jgi:hypothetical protein
MVPGTLQNKNKCSHNFQFFKIKIIDDEAKVFFQNIVQSNIKYREEHNVVRPDMINLLIQMRKNEVIVDSEKKYDDAGYATVHEELKASTEKHAEVNISKNYQQHYDFLFLFYKKNNTSFQNGMTMT